MLKLIALALFAVSAPAFAIGTTATCQFPAQLPGSVEVNYDSGTKEDLNGWATVTAKLTIGDKEIPMIREYCTIRGIKGHQSYFCSYVDGATRYEVYPRFFQNADGTTDGTLDRVGVIRTSDNGGVMSFTTSDCK